MPAVRANRVCHETGARPRRQFHGALRAFRFSSYLRAAVRFWVRMPHALPGGWAGHPLVLRPRDYVTKLVSGLLTCKLPLDGGPVAVHAASPGPSLLAQASDVSDSAFS